MNNPLPNLCKRTQGPTSRTEVCCVCTNPLLASTETVTHNACGNAICLEYFVQWRSTTRAGNKCVWCCGPLSDRTEDLVDPHEIYRVAVHVETVMTAQRAHALYDQELQADTLHLQTLLPWADASDIQAALRPLHLHRQQRATAAAVQEPWEPYIGLPPSLMNRYGPDIAQMYAQAQVRAHESQLTHWSSTEAERAASHDEDLRLIVDAFGSQPPMQTTVAYQSLPDSTLTVDQLSLQELTAINMSNIAQLTTVNTSSATTSDTARPTSSPPSTRNVAGLIAFFREMQREAPNSDAR